MRERQNWQDMRCICNIIIPNLNLSFIGSGYCPKIYFNHRCFSGPFLSKGRIAELPKCVGPGPISLVMKEVLSMLITVAYKSSRVLREIQMEEGSLAPNMHQQILKAKWVNDPGAMQSDEIGVIKNRSQRATACNKIRLYLPKNCKGTTVLSCIFCKN